MSRDFRPIELYIADLQQNNALRQATFRWRDSNGNLIDTHTPLYYDLRKSYVNLSFLFERLEEIYRLTSNMPDARNVVLCRLEQELNTEIKSILVNESYSKSASVVKRWLLGELDSSFYYHEYNDDLFFDYIIKRIKTYNTKHFRV